MWLIKLLIKMHLKEGKRHRVAKTQLIAWMQLSGIGAE